MKRKHGALLRLASLCMALLLTAGMFGTSALAAPIQENTGSISVSGVEDSVAVTACRVMDVSFDYTGQQPVDPVYVWSEAVREWVSDHHPDYIDSEDSGVTEAFSKETAANIAAFYDAMAAAIRSTGAGSIDLTASGTCTGNGTIGNLPMGGYLILIENGMKVYRPSEVNIVPVYNETDSVWEMSAPAVEVKSSEPSIDKKVNGDEDGDHDPDISDDAGIGDTVTFDIRADIPLYPENAIAKNYAISDTLSKGLSLTADSVKVYGVSGTVETELAEGMYYTRSTARPDGANSTGSTSFTLHFDYDKIQSYESIHVSYSAVLNGNAVIGPDGNGNGAVLDYNNNPYDSSSWKTRGDEVKVYSYGIDVRKVNKEGALLAGAEFTLSGKEDGSDPLLFIKTGDGAYRLAESSAESGAVTTLAVGTGGEAKGRLLLSGLAEGTFYLTETKAPDDGYYKLSRPVSVEIRDEDKDGQPASGSSSTEFGDGYVDVEVINSKSFTLPQTGGMGAVLFTAGGILLMGAALILFAVLHKRKAD